MILGFCFFSFFFFFFFLFFLFFLFCGVGLGCESAVKQIRIVVSVGRNAMLAPSGCWGGVAGIGDVEYLG